MNDEVRWRLRDMMHRDQFRRYDESRWMRVGGNGFSCDFCDRVTVGWIRVGKRDRSQGGVLDVQTYMVCDVHITCGEPVYPIGQDCHAVHVGWREVDDLRTLIEKLDLNSDAPVPGEVVLAAVKLLRSVRTQFDRGKEDDE